MNEQPLAIIARGEAWLAAQDVAVMTVLLLVIGISLLGKGLGGLT